MRRLALLALVLLLPACQTLVGSPFDGGGKAIADTETFKLNPNQPQGDAPNLLRVMGKPVDEAPLQTEPGNIWPGPVKPPPTLQDLERTQSGASLAAPGMPGTGMPGRVLPAMPVVPMPKVQ